MDSVGVGDVMHGGLAGVELTFLYLIDRVAAIAMHISAGNVSMRVVLCSRRLFVLIGCLLRLLGVVVLRKGTDTQAAENQYNPKFANGCHIHVRKGFCQIGCKSTKRISFRETRKIIFPKKIG
jgi:hypothetical protein